jgi:hypothetical protein
VSGDVRGVRMHTARGTHVMWGEMPVPGGPGMPAARSRIVNGQRPDASPAPQSRTESSQGAIERLASLVEALVVRLEAPATEPAGAPPGELVSECNAALEACLELLRDPGDRDDLVRTARADLHRLARLLKLVDGADVPFVMRQIRRVLGRFDACGGRLRV